MKGIKFAGALALALICGTWTSSSLDVFALENTTVVTASQLNDAIENAENALQATAGVASVAGMATYLRGLVNEAKALSYDIEGNQNENLGELIDALNEGARGIILVSGVDAKEEVTTTTQNPTSRMVAAEVATTMADLGVAVTVSGDEPVAEKKTEIAEASELEVEADEAESVDDAEKPLSENDQVEVPNTGENTPSPIAVGITVGVVVFVALAGALAIVKRLKRDA